jgi:SAM-dependent methyltransferase
MPEKYHQSVAAMSQSDRAKWNERYSKGAYAERKHPSALLAEWIDRIPRGRALDVACGAGRNALFLAGHGFKVDAIVISAEALARARKQAQQNELNINWIEYDLDEPLTLDCQYALILIIRYVNLPLIRRLKRNLAPGGFLLCEEHLVSDADVIGPSNNAFRVEPGALGRLARDLRIHLLEEAVVDDPDNRPAALARLVAQKAPAGKSPA